MQSFRVSMPAAFRIPILGKGNIYRQLGLSLSAKKTLKTYLKNAFPKLG